MRNKKLLFALLTLHNVFGQGEGTFQNLGFESALVETLPAMQGEIVSTDEALPGWRVFVGTREIVHAYHNSISLSGSLPSILGPHYYPTEIIEDNYTAVLRAYAGPGEGDISLVQTGQFHPNAKSIQFKTLFAEEGDIRLSFGGVPLQVLLIEATPTYSVFGANVGDLAGRMGELSFTAIAPGVCALDSIRFFGTPIRPRLSIVGSTVGIVISWPAWAEAEGYILEKTRTHNLADGWIPVPFGIVRDGDFMTLTVNDSEGIALYRK